MSIRTVLELSTRGFNANLDAATQRVRQRAGEMRTATSGLGASFAGAARSLLPAVTVAGFGASIKSALQQADDIADLKISLNETAESLQRVDFAAQQMASVGVKDVANAILRLERNLGDLQSTTAGDALANLGVTAEQLARLPLEEKIVALSRAFQQARETGTGVDAVMDLLGRSGANLIPMLGQTEEALRDMFANAPVVADELIDRMAILNDQFDGLVAKSKTAGIGIVGALSEVGTFLKDLVTTGSIEEALLAFDDRQVEALRNIDNQRRARETQGDAFAGMGGEEAASALADEAAKTEEEIQKIKDRLETDQLNLLPDDQKLAALKEKLDALLKDTVGMFGLNFETTVEGLAKLVTAREGMENLPARGQNSVLEALNWLAEARQLEAQIAGLEGKLDETGRPADLERLREQSGQLAFDALDPASQARLLRNQLSQSLGIPIGSEADIADAIERLSDLADDLMAEGDVAGEAEVRQRLIEAQTGAARLRGIAGAFGGDAAPTEMGSVARLVNQVMGRDPQQLLLEEVKQTKVVQEQQKTVLDQILAKMDDPPPADVFSGNGIIP